MAIHKNRYRPNGEGEKNAWKVIKADTRPNETRKLAEEEKGVAELEAHDDGGVAPVETTGVESLTENNATNILNLKGNLYTREGAGPFNNAAGALPAGAKVLAISFHVYGKASKATGKPLKIAMKIGGLEYASEVNGTGSQWYKITPVLTAKEKEELATSLMSETWYENVFLKATQLLKEATKSSIFKFYIEVEWEDGAVVTTPAMVMLV